MFWSVIFKKSFAFMKKILKIRWKVEPRILMNYLKIVFWHTFLQG